MEVADVAQISALGSEGRPRCTACRAGLGAIDSTKPLVLVIGHNVPPAAHIIDYLQDHGLMGKVEVAGICCTALDYALEIARAGKVDVVATAHIVGEVKNRGLRKCLFYVCDGDGR